MAMFGAAAGADGPYELPMATRVLYSPEGVKVNQKKRASMVSAPAPIPHPPSAGCAHT